MAAFLQICQERRAFGVGEAAIAYLQIGRIIAKTIAPEIRERCRFGKQEIARVQDGWRIGASAGPRLRGGSRRHRRDPHDRRHDCKNRPPTHGGPLHSAA
ncbi:hypothetical protein [Mesorhizobium sp. 131-2-1]|uniref:hypothetical protein n=1 Tax=Mesorhizobium sp. 131-2-1 TaxID=2744518 RepID=UPI001925C8EE|nr:hypothetical protein [Mesorhizobium sp. 131-2-1]